MRRLRNVHKMCKNIVLFWLWFNKRKVVQNRGELTVPKDVFFLPCGCHRTPRDPSFRIFYERDSEEWVHYCKQNDRGRGTPVVQQEKAPVDRVKSSLNLSSRPDYLIDGGDTNSALSE